MFLVQTLILIFTVSANLFLAVLVYLKSAQNEIKINFFNLCLSVAGWAICVYLSISATGREQILFWRNLSYVGPSFIAGLLVQFGLIFPKKRLSSKIILLLLFAPAFFFTLLASAGKIVSAVTLSPQGKLQGVENYFPAFYLFAFYFLSYVVFAFSRIFLNYLEARAIAKMQLRYLFTGMFLSVALASITNLALPAVGEIRLISIGPIFSFIFLGTFAYTIIKHRLMDIKIFIRRGLIYSIMTVLVALLYLGLILFFNNLFRQFVSQLNLDVSLPITILVVFLIALGFRPLLDSIKKIIDHLFYPERVSYQRAFRESAHILTSLINLRSILNLFITVIPEELKTASIRIFLFDEAKKRFTLKSAAGDLRGKLEKTIIPEDDPMIVILKKLAKPLDLEVLKREPVKKSAPLKNIIQIMEEMGSYLVIPFFTKNKLIAFLVLGPKISQEMYSQEEVDLLSALADEGAVAIENAELYQEVLDMKNYQEDILKAMTTGIISVNLEGKIITLNPKTEEMLGFSSEEAIGDKIFEILKNPGIRNMIPEILATGKHYSDFELELERKNGQKIFVALNTSFLKNSEKKIIGILITLSDLTKIRTLEEQIRQAEKLATMGELVAGVAHEINNPVTSINCYQEILESSFKESGTEVQVKTLEGLKTAVAHLKKVVENFLRFARKTQEVWFNTDIKKVISDALAITQPNIRVSNVEVEEVYEPGLPEIFADHHQLVQVFTNLIVNGCHAMPKGGRLTFEVNSDTQKNEIEIMVSDTGVGISPENLPKIFDSFFTTKELTQGTGLGLSVSLGIIKKHQGTIDVKSEINRGTTFIVRLPIAKK